jgi:ribosomal-protein-alanine N-acetyltransferase
MLIGRNINLRVVEQSDIELYHHWINSREVAGKYNPWRQISKDMLVNLYKDMPEGSQIYIIEKKDQTRIGAVANFTVKTSAYELLEIGFFLDTFERRKGYCTEAVMILVDYIFLSKDIPRIQAISDLQNIGAHKVLEKAGFIREGVIHCMMFNQGEWRDAALYSILRRDWEGPKILSK